MLYILFWLFQIVADVLLIYVLSDKGLRDNLVNRFIKSDKNHFTGKNKQRKTTDNKTDDACIEYANIESLLKRNADRNKESTDKIIQHIRNVELLLRQICSQKEATKTEPQTTTSAYNATSVKPIISEDTKLHKTYYAFNASSNNPLAFSLDDLAESMGDKPFVINIQSSNNATYSLVQNREILHPLLNTLAYYERIIDVDNKTTGEVRQVNIISEGQLVLESNLWIIKNKLKIRLL